MVRNTASTQTAKYGIVYGPYEMTWVAAKWLGLQPADTRIHEPEKILYDQAVYQYYLDFICSL